MGGVAAPVDWSQQYLTFKALENGTFKIGNATQYSLDKGATWTSLAANTNSPTVSAGNTIMWKATITPNGANGIGTFSSTGNFDAMGNPLSLIFGDSFKDVVDLTGYNNAFRRLFRYCSKLISIENMKLVATTLIDSCYSEMFASCSELTKACELPSELLAPSCYGNMFKSCISLVAAPNLPAKTFKNSCYSSMFESCTSLVDAPEIALTGSAGYYCCAGMFKNCNSLEIAPVLHCTTMNGSSSCYREMFNGCSKLNYIKAMFTTTPSSSTTSNWLNGVAASGTFVKNSAATWNVTGADGVPDGWTVITADS